MRFDLSKTETLLICPTILTQDLFLMSHVCTFAAFRTIGYVFRKYNFIRKSTLKATFCKYHG